MQDKHHVSDFRLPPVLLCLHGFVHHLTPPILPSPLSVSKQQAVIPSQVFELADGCSSYQDFGLTRNNRFSSALSSRNIIQPPAAVLHFYNAPPTLSQHQLHEVRSHLQRAYEVTAVGNVGFPREVD